MFLLLALLNIFPIIFYIIPHRFLMNKKSQVLYCLFWLGFLIFYLCSMRVMYLLTQGNKNFISEEAARAIYIGFGMIFICSVAAIIGAVSRYIVLNLESQAEERMINNRFFHATSFLVFQFLTPILLGGVYLFLPLVVN